MATHPSPEENNAMQAFLACSKGTLEERARLWAIAEKEAEQQMQVKTEARFITEKTATPVCPALVALNQGTNRGLK